MILRPRHCRSWPPMSGGVETVPSPWLPWPGPCAVTPTTGWPSCLSRWSIWLSGPGSSPTFPEAPGPLQTQRAFSVFGPKNVSGPTGCDDPCLRAFTLKENAMSTATYDTPLRVVPDLPEIKEKFARAAAGCQRIFVDKASGKLEHCPALDTMLDQLRPGDSVTVWRLDRLGRSLRHLIDLVADLENRSVTFRSLTEAIDTSTPGGKLGDKRIGSIRQGDIQGLVKMLEAKNLAAGTVRNIYDTTARIFASAVDDRVIPSSPCHRIKLPQGDQGRLIR
jgi:Resolvase, N terminal domain